MSSTRFPALTLWQPWAQLLIEGPKRNETRGWAPPSCLIGRRILIHAAARAVRPQELDPALRELCFHRFGSDYARTLARGAILGSAELARVSRMTEVGPASETDRICGVWLPERFAWLFEGRIAWPKPSPIRGAQRIWYV